MTKTKQKPVHIFWIFGNLRQAKAKWNSLCQYIEQHVGVAPKVETIYCGDTSESSMKDVVFALRSKDMFSDSPRIIKVVGIPEDYNDLLFYTDIPKPHNLLVFWGTPGYYKPGSKKWISLKITKLFKFVKQHGKVYEFPTEARTDSEAITSVIDIAAEKGKELSRETARLVVSRLGRGLDLLESHIEKLATYQTGSKILQADVEACCAKGFYGTVWDYINSLDKGDCGQALSYLQQLYEDKPATGDNFYGVLNKVIGALRQHFTFVTLARDISTSVNVKAIEESAKGCKKFTPTQLSEIQAGNSPNIPDWFSSGYIRNQINNSNLARLLGQRKSIIYGILRDLLFCAFYCRLNSGNDAYLKLSFDVFTLLACGKINSRQAALARGHCRKYLV